MRDLVIIAICVLGSLSALRRPWIGVMLWTWLSIMNPHRYTYGLAYSAPLAAAAAGSTLIGLLMTHDRESPFKARAVTILSVFMAWMTISWLMGMDPESDFEQWKKVMKIDVMILIALALLHTKQHIFALMWTAVISLASLGAKGGIYTLTTGGGGRVWGPPGSFIEDNNEFAVALVMTIPLIRFLQLQLTKGWARHLMTLSMVLCAISALGSQSRGALLAISAMAMYFWWNGKNKLVIGILIVAIAVPLVAFMPDTWSDRMATIQTYGEDKSAMGRISAWWTAWRLAFDYPFGVGFNAFRPILFAKYSPYPDMVHAAHSIYFQTLGHHGFVGLFLFMGIWIATWKSASWLRDRKDLPPEAKWCADLGAMCQVSLVAYLVGGAFLSLAYFDLPYNIMVMVVVTRIWVEKQKWKTDSDYRVNWRTIPGLVFTPKVSPKAGR